MAMVFLKKYWIKYFNLSLQPNQQGREQVGLSLSYDIVKAHGGELKVKTKEGEGSEFIFQIPMLNCVMKRKLFFSILSLSLLGFCRAQDSAVVLSASMFDEYFQIIPLTAKDGWIFKEGNEYKLGKERHYNK
jgi:hypothetical protein